MANKHRGEMTLNIGTKTITLAPTYNSFTQIEDELGMCLFDVAQRMSNGQFTLKHLVKAVEILSGEDNLGDAIFEQGYSGIMAKVGNCLVIGIAGNPSGKAKVAGKGK